MTVPFILALGVGVSAIRSDPNAETDSFGLVALSSVGPIPVSYTHLRLVKSTRLSISRPLTEAKARRICRRDRISFAP